MDTYHQLTSTNISTRQAKRLTGIARSSADRDRRRPTPARPVRRPPANALSGAEREQVLHVLKVVEFVDAAPAQVYAALLDQGVYVGSIATMYRLLREHEQLRERRRLARHRPGNAPNWSPTGPGRSTPGTSPNSPVP